MRFLFLLSLCIFSNSVFAHHIDYNKIILKEWSLAAENKALHGTLYMYKNGLVYIEDAQNKIIHYPLSCFSKKDQDYVINRYKKIAQENTLLLSTANNNTQADKQLTTKFWIIAFILSALGFFTFLLIEKSKRKYLNPVFFLGVLFVLYGFKDDKLKAHLLSTTDPVTVDLAFAPFKPKVYTHWDNTYFYVESKGIPDHQMMVGITAWQQQVPIPQCYTTANNNNAWSIPLNPVIATSPVPVNQQHFLRGAIAVAVNGVAIFNPYTNTGIDAYLDGQLDNWGGHCGRADDYHYHTAPLHLYSQTTTTLPIAFALDGFAVYGNTEPDGSSMFALDGNHGHYGNNGTYHYHGTATAPYMIGNMVGVVTEDATLQIIPQPAAKPIRPAGAPLSGATITNCLPNNTNTGYNLTYTKTGQNYQVNYNWADSTTTLSKYTFNFINPGSTTVSVYGGFSQSQCSVPTGTTQSGESKTMIRLPDTGEITGYTATFGEDADYLINTPFFINNGNGTVTDTITGLMWQKTDGGEMIIENARIYCDTLSLAGYNNWRLPNAHEGFSILNHQYNNPSLDANYFTVSNAQYWWTSTVQINDSSKIWTTNAGGGVGNKPKIETISAGGSFRYHARAVRDVTTPLTVVTHFTNNTNETVTDNFTNLIWQKTPAADSLSWINALLYADTLSFAGITEWRLPNIKELQSINNEKLSNPSVDTNYFKVINNKKFWSSTTLPNQIAEAWYLNNRFGITSYDLKTNKDYVICVSSGASYIFNGNGNWDIASNWLNNKIPPTILPAGYSIVIDPITGGQCVLNITQHISRGAGISVNPGKNMLIQGYLIQQ